MDPADALASLLQVAGVAAAQVPDGLAARMAVWRDKVAGKQLLLVLDDAASSEQVRPLLPGAAGSVVLVTSHRHLVALEDVRAISLDTPAPPRRRSFWCGWRAGLAPQDAAVTELAGCADACRWRWGCWPASSTTTRPGPPRTWLTTPPRAATGSTT